MKRSVKAKLALFSAPLLALLLAVACGGGPQDLEVPVTLEEGGLNPATIQVGQDDRVTLKIETQEAGEFHLHGYDLERDVAPGATTDLYFVADATGRFRITFHPAGESSHAGEGDGHGEVFQSEVLQPGDTFTFQVPADAPEGAIPFHSHLHPAEVYGSIAVARDAPAADHIAIDLGESGASPAEATVRPGTTITWSNNTGKPQSVVSGHHPEGTHEETGLLEGEEGEQEVGFLEVRPR